MTKFKNFIKTYYKSLILILIFLIIQVFSDLSLPSYTSDIINVGVANNGIDEISPKRITEKDFNELLELTKKEDKIVIESNYELKGNIYYLKDNKVTDKLLVKPIALNILSKTGEFNLSSINDMDEIEKEETLNIIYDKIPELSESNIKTMSSKYLKEIYINANLDINKIQSNYIRVTGLKMIALALVSMATTIGVAYIGARMAADFSMCLRNEVFTKVLAFSQTEVKKFGTASLITRSTNDVTQIQMMIVMIIRTVIYAPILGIGALLKVLSTKASLTWIIAVAIALILIVMLTIFILVMPKYNKLQKSIDKLNLVTREILNGILPVRAFSNEKHEEERFEKENKNLNKLSLFVNKIMTCMMPVLFLIMNLITLLIVYYGAKQIDLGNIQLGDMMAIIQYTIQIIMAFLMISMVSIMIPRAIVSLKRIKEILNQDISIKNSVDAKRIDKCNGKLEFKKVSFRYEDADYDVLSDISFIAERNKTTAIIGSTGSGKSTLVNLIPRLMDVTTGEILLDDKNIEDIDIKDLREKISYISQKGILLSGTIESNIKYGNSKLKENEMEQISEIAQCKEFIDDNEKRFKREIAQGGTNVSGGQKQRISIARALAKNSDIIIFDDSFSALDYKTDKLLRKEIKAKLKDKTIIIVAQRIATIMDADQIIVLDEGSVSGIGIHKELLKSNEIYRQIALSQLSESEVLKCVDQAE